MLDQQQQVRWQQLNDFTFVSGNGDLDDRTLCVMEAVAYVAGEEVSDHPLCTSPALTEFGIRLNDASLWENDAERKNFLLTFVPKLIGTKDAALELTRAKILVEAALREFAPRALRSAIELLKKRGLDTSRLESTLDAFVGNPCETTARAAAYAAAAGADYAAYVAADAAAAARAAAAAARAAAADYAAAAAAYAAAAARAAAAAASTKRELRDLALAVFDRAIEVSHD